MIGKIEIFGENKYLYRNANKIISVTDKLIMQLNCLLNSGDDVEFRRNFLPLSSGKLQIANSYETIAPVYQNARHHITEDTHSLKKSISHAGYQLSYKYFRKVT
jgi:hypothetical protein